MQTRIIQFLKQGEGYISGEDMSRELNISRTAVWKYIDQLRQEGYDINAVPHLGYKLESVPDKLLAHEIKSGLTTKFMGQNVVAHETVKSTMDEAFVLGMQGACEGTIICAETQTKGRGRLGRSWISPKAKGLYFSLILRPKFAPSQMAQLTLMSAVALAEGINRATGVIAQIKWPNDLLVHDLKLAGILTELRAEMDQVQFVVIGIGLNVNAVNQQPVDEATSLRMLTGTHFNRIILLQDILKSMEAWYDILNTQGFAPVIKAWKKQSCTLNSRVRLTDSAGAIEGLAFDLDKDGGLLIRQDSGAVIKRISGDVTRVRKT